MGHQNRHAYRRSYGPHAKYRRMIATTRGLINGTNLEVGLVDLGVRVKARVWWREGRHLEVDRESMTIRPLPDAPVIAKRLLKKFGPRDAALKDALEDDAIEALQKHPTFKGLDTRIKEVCAEADKLERANPDFCWDSDVLRWAEG